MSFPNTTTSAQRRAGVSQLHILFVEHQTEVRDTLADLLESAGYLVTAVAGTDEALACAMPDVLLYDIGSLEYGGCDPLEELRAQQGWEDLPVVAIVDAGLPTAARLVERAGFQQCISKPVSFGELDRALRSAVAA